MLNISIEYIFLTDDLLYTPTDTSW